MILKSPEGWTVERLLDLVSIRSGLIDPKLAQYRDMPLIAPDHIESGTGRLLEVRSAREQGAISGKYLVDPGDIIYSKIRPYLMKVHRAEFPALCSADMYALKPRSGADGRFVLNLLLGRDFTNYAVGESMRSGIPKINREGLAGYEVPVPPHPEQEMIGTALGDASDLVQSLERVITKRRAIKHGIMQQLLTGRTRLPGFSEPWQSVALGEHVSYVKTVALSRAQLDASSPLRYLHYGDIHTRGASVLDASSEHMPRAPKMLARNAGLLQMGDLVFADASEDPDGVGKSVEIIGVPIEGVIPGLHTIAARFDKRVLADGFKGYLQFIDAFRRQLLALAAGTKVLATTRAHISSIELVLPGVVEQTAIAEVLRDADLEIASLERRIEAARSIKQGMMQELLAGGARLVPMDVST